MSTSSQISAVVISLHRNIPAPAASPAGFSLDPSLAAAVLGILDVLARVQHCPPVKTQIDVSAMRGIAVIVYNSQQPVAFLDALNSVQSAVVFASQMRFR